MSKASDIQEIKNPQEFKEFYFTDESYFNPFLKKQTGIIPPQFRKNHKH